MTVRSHHSDLILYRRLLSEARPYRRHLVATFLMSLLSAPLVLLSPLPLKIAVDNVIGTEPLPGFLSWATPHVLIAVAGLFLAISLLHQLQVMGTSLLRTYTGEQLVLGFRTRLFHQAQRLSVAYHDTKGAADSTFRIQWDAPHIRYLMLDAAIPFCIACVTLVGMICVIAAVDWRLAMVALTVSPLILAVSQAYRARLRNLAHKLKEVESSAFSVVQEVLGALRVVKAFGQEPHEDARFSRRSAEGFDARIVYENAEAAFGFVIGLSLSAGTAIVLYVGARQVQSGAITLGALLLVMSYLFQLYEPLRSMSEIIGRLQSHLASAERAFGFLDEMPDVPERPNARSLSRAAGKIAFRNVSFAYPGGRLALQNASFEISPGTRVGIIGETGAGKTTLMSLLARFYDPTGGQILLDGLDLREYKLADLRRQFAIMLQEPVLFSTTVGENISYAQPSASHDDIVAAAKAANVHEFIVSLPEGYRTVVGERGMSLSGGERQRISLARAFLKDAPILILDEPTSSVDVGTEAAIMTTIGRLAPGRTTFIIAHRLSALKDCDILFRIDDGTAREVPSLEWGDIGLSAATSNTKFQ